MICLTFYILCMCNTVFSSRSIEVYTTLGKVRGKLVDDATTGASYYSFEGIPYAEAPVGILRFKPPVQIRPWSITFDATKPGLVCPQIELVHSRKEMDEDCLNFNVYTPANSMNKLLPVIFNIHGGDFMLLSGKSEPIYGPQLLILNNIVVVSMNYRLGALGFLSLCTEQVSGNAGIKDVLLALDIVHKNIRNFGGDPNKISIMGHGAGAAMAEILMLTKESINLFNSVIVRSGSSLSSEYLQLDPRKNAILLARKLGLDFSDNDCLVEGLRKVNAFDIVKAQEEIARKDPQRGFRSFRPFKPTVEIKCGSAVLTRPPLELIREGAIHDIPMLIGFNNQEGLKMFPLLRQEPQLIDSLNQNFELLIPSDIRYPKGSKARKNLAMRIRDFYFKGGNISFVNIQNYVNLISDSQYTFSIDFLVKLFKEKKTAPVYYSIFTVDSDLNWYKAVENITYPGAAHFDNIGYIFLTSVTKPRYKYLDSNVKRVQTSIMLSIKYFMNYGAPAPNPITNCWPEAGKGRFHLIHDYNSRAVFHRPLRKRLGFWRSVYEEYFNSKWNNVQYFCANEDVGYNKF